MCLLLFDTTKLETSTIPVGLLQLTRFTFNHQRELVGDNRLHKVVQIASIDSGVSLRHAFQLQTVSLHRSKEHAERALSHRGLFILNWVRDIRIQIQIKIRNRLLKQELIMQQGREHPIISILLLPESSKLVAMHAAWVVFEASALDSYLCRWQRKYCMKSKSRKRMNSFDAKILIHASLSQLIVFLFGFRW